MPPRISIIIPNHNYAPFLPEFFAALEAQTMDLGQVEAIFVDDDSRDDSLAVAQRLGNDLPLARFELVASGRLGHPALTRNLGLGLATAENVACLDPDDLPAPEFLEACLKRIDAPDAPQVVYCDYVEQSPSDSRRVSLPDFDPEVLSTQNILTMAAVFKREVWTTGQGFRANTAYEDWDFWVRAAELGFSFARIPRPLYVYRQHQDNFSSSAVAQDGAAKAAIVANTPDFFHPEVRRWATGIAMARAWATPGPRGLIPRAQDVRRLRELYRTIKGRLDSMVDMALSADEGMPPWRVAS